MSNILECVVQVLPVALVPEIIIKYLQGDVSLDALDSKTFENIFQGCGSIEFETVVVKYTYLDPDNLILHSFYDQPSMEVIDDNFFPKTYKQWHKNGKLHRDNNLPALVKGNYFEWWINGEKIDDSMSRTNKIVTKIHQLKMFN